MASTFSANLALELIGTGDQSGTWGSTTNGNFGLVTTNTGLGVEAAISGYVTVDVSVTPTITIPNGTTGVARNMYLELTNAGAGTLNVPANRKLYFIYNNTASAVTVKVTGLTGVAVPAGKKCLLVCNGTDIVEAVNQIVGTLGLTSPAITTSITTPSTSFTAFAGATTLLTIGGTGASSVFAIPGTLEATGTTGSVTIAGGLYVAKATNHAGLVTASAGITVAASQAITGTVANSTISGFLSVAATTGTFTNIGGTLSTAAQPNVTSTGTLSVPTSVSITGTSDLAAGLKITATTTARPTIDFWNATTGNLAMIFASDDGGFEIRRKKTSNLTLLSIDGAGAPSFGGLAGVGVRRHDGLNRRRRFLPESRVWIALGYGVQNRHGPGSRGAHGRQDPHRFGKGVAPIDQHAEKPFQHGLGLVVDLPERFGRHNAVPG